MTTIYTIGFTRKTLGQFIWLVQQAGVDAVIDIRLRNTSQLAGFAIGYEHRPELAPTPEILATYKAGGEWAIYERQFIPLLPLCDAGAIGRQLLSRYQRPCLLCAEPTPEHCHRRLVAEWWAEHLPDVEVVHLI